MSEKKCWICGEGAGADDCCRCNGHICLQCALTLGESGFPKMCGVCWVTNAITDLIIITNTDGDASSTARGEIKRQIQRLKSVL